MRMEKKTVDLLVLIRREMAKGEKQEHAFVIDALH